MSHGLTDSQVATLRAVLAPHADRLEQVGLFGSRATGTWRPNSDVDLVLYGPIDRALEQRLWTLFDDSSLPLVVDVHAYDLIASPGLKAHVDAVMQPLFSHADLTPTHAEP